MNKFASSFDVKTSKKIERFQTPIKNKAENSCFNYGKSI